MRCKGTGCVSRERELSLGGAVEEYSFLDDGHQLGSMLVTSSVSLAMTARKKCDCTGG
jgi:hypothetical protein